MRNDRRHRLLLLAAAWAAFLGLNIGLAPRRFLPQVSVETVRRGVFPLIVRAPAVLQPKHTLVIKAQFDGPVISKKYQEGTDVHKGDLLIEIGRDRVRAEFESKIADVANAKADLLQAKKEVKLQKRLFQKQAVSETSVEDAERAHVRAEQSLQMAEEAFKLEKLRWESNRILAPFSGRVLNDALGDDHEVASDKEILTVADISDFTLKARVDELDIGLVKVGQDVEVRLQAYEGTPLHAKVLRLGSQAEGNALPEIPVFLQLETIGGLHLVPKLSAETRIGVGEDTGMLSVPLVAVDNADGISKVWVVNRYGFIERRIVILGKSNPDRVEVLQGLKIDERICMAPEPHWANGMKVRILP